MARIISQGKVEWSARLEKEQITPGICRVHGYLIAVGLILPIVLRLVDSNFDSN